MDNKYNLTFDVWKEMPSVWNQRESSHLAHTISVCRMGRFMKFKNYGHFTYTEEDSYKKFFPIIEELDGYSRKNANCMIFDLNIPNCDYDKVFVYQIRSGLKGSMGYYIHSSTNPDHHIHKYYLANDINTLLLSLNMTIYNVDIQHNGTEIKANPYMYGNIFTVKELNHGKFRTT